MTDKYTQMAEEWVREHGMIAYFVGEMETLASLLRQVAREQIEEDAGIVDLRTERNKEGAKLNRSFGGDEAISSALRQEYAADNLERIAAALRSRAKELTTEPNHPGPTDSP